MPFALLPLTCGGRCIIIPPKESLSGGYMETKVPFRELPYRRVEKEEIEEAFRVFFHATEGAESAEDVIRAREELIVAQKNYATAVALAFCRFSLDTRDAFYKNETDYYDRMSPVISASYHRYCRLMLSSPFRKGLEAKLGRVLFSKFEAAVKTHSDECIEDKQEENALVTKYSELMSGLLFPWEGRRIPLPLLSGKLQDGDPSVRFAAAKAIGKGLRERSEELDELYDRLVSVRTRIARKLGYKNFIPLGYCRMNRTDYDSAMTARFRANVLQDVVPVVCRLKEALRQEFGLDVFRFSDNEVYLRKGNPSFSLSAEAAFAAAEEMYDKMDGEIGAYYRTMREEESFDVLPREGKCGGGFCESFPAYRREFIFANFNGTTGDIDVFTHEFGHAFAMHACAEAGTDFEVGIGGMETAECHSMSMEFLAWPYMEKFFPGKAQEYRFKHLADALSFLPYGCIVDEFQHIVYENPSMTPKERNKAYLSLEEKYRPYLTYCGIPYLEEGTRWQYQGHIFQCPFYYIDYCLAQTVALGFLLRSREDAEKALAEYKRFARTGGSLPFGALVGRAGLPDPFQAGTLRGLSKQAWDLLEELRRKI